MFSKLYSLIFCVLNIHRAPECRIHPRYDFSEPLPVILRNGVLLEPNENLGFVTLNNGESLILSCEGSGFIANPNTNQDVSVAPIRCVGGNIFENTEWLNAPSPFRLFSCHFPPNYGSERTNRTCFDNNALYEVGYTVQNTFYPVYESCFDETDLRPIYSKYTQKPYNHNFQTKVERPFFISNNVYGYVPVESLFSPRELKSAVLQLVGPMIDTYVTKTQLLSRGHLAAKTDFVFAFGERATFHYVNCAPQWTGFNGGNWNTLEVDLRKHVHDAGYNTIIYTGTYGVTQLSNQYGRKVDIYLYTDRNNNPIIPVPQYFYKVVYEPDSRRGIAFVGINNPYYNATEARELFFCRDVCRSRAMNDFHWLTWNPDNPEEGYTFCCALPDFIETVNHLPRLQIDGLLT